MTISLRRLFFSRLTVLILMTALGGYFLYNLKGDGTKPGFVKFGIDLVGGTYMTLEVQVKKAQESELGDRMQELHDLLDKNNQPVPFERKLITASSESSDAKTHNDMHVIMKFDSVNDAAKAATFLMKRLKDMLIDQSGSQITLRFTDEQLRSIGREAVESNILALNNRINQFGVGETLVTSSGESRIIVELPNVHNTQEAKEIIGKAALLQIKLVEAFAHTEEALLAQYDGDLPEGTEIVAGKPGRKQEFYLVPTYTDITGKLLKTARLGYGGKTGIDPVVEFEFKSAGADRFYDLTSQNMGQRIAVIVDGEVITAPVVQAAISDHGTITGDFTAEEAQQLALLLRSGSFVAPVTFEEERHIGPSLGQESIYQGLLACLVGLIFLFVFAIVTYKTAGILAFIVLLYNLLLVLVALWALGATLTLPGIAGMILTIGMAIDASILIYERIKEELALGVPFKKAVATGFSGSLAVIIDANITNLMIAIVLYKLGSGPIQGFAVTMIVGMVATLVTGLWLLKSFYTYLFDVVGINKIKI